MIKQRFKRAIIIILASLIVFTYLPLQGAYADPAGSGTEEIQTFTAKLVRGTDDSENNTWTPETNDIGHKFVYRLSYAFSGTGEAEKDTIKIRVPKHLIRDRKGNYQDEFDVGVPEERDADSRDDFAYREGSGEDKDYFIIYNNRSIPAAQAGTIEVSYALTEKVSAYTDMQESDPFKASIEVKSQNGTLTETKDADSVRINTRVEIGSSVKRVPDGYFYRKWQNRWGNKPSDADGYYYLVWEVKTKLKPHSTQPYDFTLDDTPGNGEVIGYKFYGESSFTSENTVKDQIPDGSDSDVRYDYILTRHEKKDLNSREKTEITNKVTAAVTPADKKDEATSSSSSASWEFTRDMTEIPGGKFYAEKNGLTENGQAVQGGEDISSYGLSDFLSGKTDVLGGLRYFVFTDGYALPYTLPEGKDGSDPSDYGKENVLYRITDESLSLNGSVLNPEDYSFSGLTLSETIRTAGFDAEEKKFVPSENKRPESTDEAVVYVKKNGSDYEKACTVNMKTLEASGVNSLLVKSASGGRIFFENGITGFRIETENAHYFSKIFAWPTVSLNRTDHVLGILGSNEKAALTNNAVAETFDHNGKSLYKNNVSASDYVMGVKKDSSLRKTITGTSNSKKKKQFTVSWNIAMSESYRDNEGRHETNQKSGVFYDLLPEGSAADLDSIAVFSGGKPLSPASYTAETKKNYRESGRTLLIVRIKASGSAYSMKLDTVSSWDDLKETKYSLYNSAVYETGNSVIADGLKDTGGTGQDREILRDLDPETDDAKFIYSQDWMSANLVTASATGLVKKVRAEEDSSYRYSTTTYPKDTYEYRISLSNDNETKSSGIILFDSLENYAKTGKSSGWRGKLIGVDNARLEKRGIEPSVYYSSIENLDVSLHHNLEETDANGNPVWVSAEEFGDPGKAKAVAFDLSKSKSGDPFILEEGESVSTLLYMQAPAEISSENTEAYNEAYAARTSQDSNGIRTDEFLRQGYTEVRYRAASDLMLRKVSSIDPAKGIGGISFRLRGTSDYGDEIDRTESSSENGYAAFKKLPAGTYKLMETGEYEDYLTDHEAKTVTVKKSGEAEVSGLDQKDGIYIFPDEPRVHGDLSIRKESSVRSTAEKEAVHAVKNTEGGGSVTIDGRIYTVISKSSLTAVLKPAEGASPGETVKKLLIKRTADGNLVISLRDTASSVIPDTTFHLSGTSDYGNDVSEDQVTDLNGRLTFRNIEKGTYTLKEAKANPDYILSASEWKVKVDSEGNTHVSDAETDGNDTLLRNAPAYHSFTLKKTDKETFSQCLTGAEFHLSGISSRGDAVEKDVTSAQDGLAEFLDIPSGSYILTEAKAPEGYLKSEGSYTVTISDYGDVLINSLTESGGVFLFPDERSRDGKITITKKWNDNGRANSQRPVPKVHLTSREPESTSVSSEKPLLKAAKRTAVKKAPSLSQTPLTGQAYAVFDSSDGSLTFFRDTEGKYIDMETEGTKTYYTGFETIGKNAPSFSSNTGIKIVTFKDEIRPNALFKWFFGDTNLTEIKGIENLDTSNAVSMYAAFGKCEKLESLDLSSFNTSNVTDMNSMFIRCSSLKTLDLSSFDTSNVTNMSYMFMHASGLTSLNVSRLNTSNVTNMGWMFYNTKNLTSLDVSHFDTSKVQKMSYMFTYCSGLSALELKNFNTQNVRDMEGMFSGCGIKMLNLSTFDTGKVTNRKDMLRNTWGLNTLILGTAWTKTDDDTSLSGSWIRVATASGRKVAKTPAVSANTLTGTYDGSAMSGIWQKEGTPEADLPIEIFEEYTSEDDKWVRNGDGTWTYTFDVNDDTSKFYAYEEDMEGYTESNDNSNPLVINGSEVTKSGVITNTRSDYGSLKVSKALAGDNLTESDAAKKFVISVLLSGDEISGTQEFGGVVFTNGAAVIALSGGESRTFTNLPPGTTYSVKESDAEGFTPSYLNNTGTVTKNAESDAVITNTKKPDTRKLTDITITKTLGGNAANPEDQFSFVIEMEGLSPSETYTAENSSSGNTQFTADAAGHVSFSITIKGGETEVMKNIPEGTKYRITEKANAYEPSYEIVNTDDNGSIRHVSDSAGKNSDLATLFESADPKEKSTIMFTNVRNKDTSDAADLVLVKKANDSAGKATDTALPGAWFNLKGSSDDGEDIDISKESDSDGRIVFKTLSKGTYTLTEKQAPGGYQKDGTKRTVTVDPEKDPAVTVTGLTQSTDNTFPVYNDPVPTYPVGFLKNDSSGSAVKNAELALYDKDENRISKWTTDGEMHTENLAEGEYTLKETLIPEGYSKADDIVFTVDSGGAVTSDTSGAVKQLKAADSGDPSYAVEMIDPSSISGLPNTGGMGTKLLYIFGAALIAIGIAAYLRKKN